MDIDLSHAVWRKSPKSQTNGACVEVARNLVGIVGVRDSKSPTGSTLSFKAAAWTSFLTGVKANSQLPTPR